MSERREGWYWVKMHCGLWTVAQLCEGVYVSVDGEWDDENDMIIGPRIPDPDEPWQCVPTEITAETGHKAGMMGEFSQSLPVMCEACAGDGEDEHESSGVCSECDGAGEYGLNVYISWTTIKAIHRRIIEIAAAPKP